MSEHVSETGEAFPVHRRMAGQKLLRQSFDRLADDDERPADGNEEFLIYLSNDV